MEKFTMTQKTPRSPEAFWEDLVRTKPSKLKLALACVESAKDVTFLVDYMTENSITSFIYEDAFVTECYPLFLQLIRSLFDYQKNLLELRLKGVPLKIMSPEVVERLNSWLEGGEKLIFSLAGHLSAEITTPLFQFSSSNVISLVEIELVGVEIAVNSWAAFKVEVLEHLQLESLSLDEKSWKGFITLLEQCTSLKFLKLSDMIHDATKAKDIGIALKQSNTLETLHIGEKQIEVGSTVLVHLQGIKSLQILDFQVLNNFSNYDQVFEAVNYVLAGGAPLVKLFLKPFTASTTSTTTIPQNILTKLNENYVAKTKSSIDIDRVASFFNAGIKMKFNNCKFTMVGEQKTLLLQIFRDSSSPSLREEITNYLSATNQSANSILLRREQPYGSSADHDVKNFHLSPTSTVSGDVAHITRIVEASRNMNDQTISCKKVTSLFLSKYFDTLGLQLPDMKDLYNPNFALSNLWMGPNGNKRIANPFIQFLDKGSVYFVCFMLEDVFEQFDVEIAKVVSLVQKIPEDSKAAIVGLLHPNGDFQEKIGVSGFTELSFRSLTSNAIWNSLNVENKQKLLKKKEIERKKQNRFKGASKPNPESYIFYLTTPFDNTFSDDHGSLWRSLSTVALKDSHQEVDARLYLGIGHVRSKLATEGKSYVDVDGLNTELSNIGLQDIDVNEILDQLTSLGEVLKIRSLIVFDKDWINSFVEILTTFNDRIITSKQLEKLREGYDEPDLLTYALDQCLLIEIGSEENKEYFIPSTIMGDSNLSSDPPASPPNFFIRVPRKYDFYLFYGIFCGYFLRSMREPLTGKMAEDCDRDNNCLKFPFPGITTKGSIYVQNRNCISIGVPKEALNLTPKFVKICQTALSETLKQFHPGYDEFGPAEFYSRHMAPYIVLPCNIKIATEVSRQYVELPLHEVEANEFSCFQNKVLRSRIPDDAIYMFLDNSKDGDRAMAHENVPSPPCDVVLLVPVSDGEDMIKFLLSVIANEGFIVKIIESFDVLENNPHAVVVSLVGSKLNKLQDQMATTPKMTENLISRKRLVIRTFNENNIINVEETYGIMEYKLVKDLGANQLDQKILEFAEEVKLKVTMQRSVV